MAKLKKLLTLDIRENDNLLKLKKALLKTTWLKKIKNTDKLTQDILEKCYRKVIKKYPGAISYVQHAGEESWLFMIKRTDNHEWIETIYAHTLFEGLSKSILVLYGYFKLGIKFKTKSD